MATPTCTYQYPEWMGHDPCPEPVWDDQGRCLFHSDSHHKVAADMVAQVKEKLEKGDKDFAGYVFPGGVVFAVVHFGDNAHFFGATFGEGATFWGACFGGGTSFDNARFGNGAVFLNATFGEGTSFGGDTFGQRADFGDARFGAGAAFLVATFGDRANFEHATFGEGANFVGATFGDGAFFVGATFGEGANFYRTTFGERADFRGATFGDGADFFGATFGDGASFGGATFGDEADFRIANPKERFLLENVTFQGRANFSGVGRDLSHFEFHHVRLPRAIFRDAIGLSKAEFDDVTWGEEPGRRFFIFPWRRQGIVGDEGVARESGKPEDFDAAERVYREIRRSYLERRDFTMARQMHWGEMEMRRLKEAARRRESHKWLDRKGLRWLADISLTWVYWWLSGYGQRWGNALVSLTALWLVCALGYTAETLSVANPAPAFAEALMNGVSQSLFSLILRPIYTPATLGGLLINFLQMVLSPIVITTLVLAVREQFRH